MSWTGVQPDLAETRGISLSILLVAFIVILEAFVTGEGH